MNPFFKMSLYECPSKDNERCLQDWLKTDMWSLGITMLDLLSFKSFGSYKYSGTTHDKRYTERWLRNYYTTSNDDLRGNV